MDEEEKKLMEENRKKRETMSRNFRLNNLKRAAEKNQILNKVVKQNMVRASMLAAIYILLGIIFIVLNAASAITQIAENAVAGLVTLLGLAGSVKDFMGKPGEEDKDNNIAIKFSDIEPDMVKLSLKTTDEDDVRNAESTIENWNKLLQFLKLSYTLITLFGSFLLLVFIIFDFTTPDSLLVPVNALLIALGTIFLARVLIDLYLLK
jgi:hypothetical protein